MEVDLWLMMGNVVEGVNADVDSTAAAKATVSRVTRTIISIDIFNSELCNIMIG